MNEALRSILLGTSGLGAVAVAALILALARHHIGCGDEQLRSAARLVLVVMLLHAVHFAEELATGFHERFPAMFGLAPWSPRFFASFNILWLAVWGLAARGLTARRHAALFFLWFLGLACVANGIAHPLLAVRAAGYFPGLLTSPLVGVMGVLLLRRLALITSDAFPGAPGK